MITAKRSITWVPVIVAMLAGAAVVGGIVWWMNLQDLQGRIEQKRTAMKKLSVSKGLPPNQEVMAYLHSRERALEQRYHHWLDLVAVAPSAEAAGADAQLYFQERFHEMQRTLERLATARGVSVPEQLGFPKELPPSETVPRLLVQLSLIQDVTSLILERGVTGLSSLKIGDPEVVPSEDGGQALLMRLPVQLQLKATLPQVLNILEAVQHVHPLIDVRTIRLISETPATSIPAAAAPSSSSTSTADAGSTKVAPPEASPTTSKLLDVELVLARYQLAAATHADGTGNARDEAAKPAGFATKRSPKQRAANREPSARGTDDAE